MEKFFSAVVELEGGEHKTLRVHGPSKGAVFQQVKAMPGVRRVGKVSELSSPDAALPSDRAHKPAAEHGRSSHEPKHVERPRGGEFAATGPRVVIHGGRSGGMQPPPERRKPLHPPKLKKPVVHVVKPVHHAAAPVVKHPVHAVKHAAELTPPAPAVPVHEYRVIKSRRQSGDPFILQRGNWHEAKGKRSFTVDWEKGFTEREKAEKHQAWLEQTQQELSDVDTTE